MQYAAEYVVEYFDQNPISQMAVIGMKDGVAVRITSLSGALVSLCSVACGDPTDRQLCRASDGAQGQRREAQAQAGTVWRAESAERARNGKEWPVVRSSHPYFSFPRYDEHRHLPTHGSREVLIIFGSLTTCDPHNIHTTIEALVKDKYVALLCTELVAQRKRAECASISSDFPPRWPSVERSANAQGVRRCASLIHVLSHERVQAPMALSSMRPTSKISSSPPSHLPPSAPNDKPTAPQVVQRPT